MYANPIPLLQRILMCLLTIGLLGTIWAFPAACGHAAIQDPNRLAGRLFTLSVQRGRLGR